MQLVELCRLPQRPSGLLEMEAAGYGPKARLAFDLAVVSFANRFEALRQETVERPAPERKKSRPTVRVPKFSEAELLAMLGIDGGGRQEAGGGWSAGPLTLDESDWDGIWGPETGPEPEGE